MSLATHSAVGAHRPVKYPRKGAKPQCGSQQRAGQKMKGWERGEPPNPSVICHQKPRAGRALGQHSHSLSPSTTGSASDALFLPSSTHFDSEAQAGRVGIMLKGTAVACAVLRSRAAHPSGGKRLGGAGWLSGQPLMEE